MNFLKRSFLSIVRRKGKTIILLAIVFILGNIMAYGVAINQATENIDTNLKKSLGGYVMIQADYNALNDAYNNGNEKIYEEYQRMSLDTIKTIGQSSYVKYYDYSMNLYFYQSDLKNCTAESDGAVYYGSSREMMSAKGVQYAPIMDAEEGKINIVDGRAFTEDEVNNGKYVAVISKAFAELNNLHVGDTMKLLNDIEDYNKYDDTSTPTIYASQDVVYEIIGIFDVNKDNFQANSNKNEEKSWLDYQLQEMYNTLYTPNEALINELKFTFEKYAELFKDEEGYDFTSFNQTDYYTPIYVLNNPEDIDNFEKEITSLLPEYYTLNYSTDSYDQVSTSIKQMGNIAKTILIGSIIATIVILTLVIVLFLRDRKQEFGIYLALGESKLKLLGQIVVEVMCVAFVAISLSLFTGNVIAKSLSSNMLQQQLEKNSNEDNSYYYTSYSNYSYLGEVSNEDVLAAYDIQLGINYIIMIYAIGLSTTLVSTVAPMIYTTRLKPKKILM